LSSIAAVIIGAAAKAGDAAVARSAASKHFCRNFISIRGVLSGRGRSFKGSKDFFFEKKKQKDYIEPIGA
jgi:hypothetical protein